MEPERAPQKGSPVKGVYMVFHVGLAEGISLLGVLDIWETEAPMQE